MSGGYKRSAVFERVAAQPVSASRTVSFLSSSSSSLLCRSPAPHHSAFLPPAATIVPSSQSGVYQSIFRLISPILNQSEQSLIKYQYLTQLSSSPSACSSLCKLMLKFVHFSMILMLANPFLYRKCLLLEWNGVQVLQ